MSRKAPLITSCPSCQAEVRFRKAPYVGQYKICADCDTELEVVSISPLKVGYLADELEIYEASYDEYEEEEDEYADYYNEDEDPEPERRVIVRDHSFELEE